MARSVLAPPVQPCKDSPDLQSFRFRGIHVSPPTGGRYTMEFKRKAALTEWTNDQTMPEIAAYYNRLPGAKPVKKFESRDVAVTRIWAVLSPDKPKVARKPKAGRMKATSRR